MVPTLAVLHVPIRIEGQVVIPGDDPDSTYEHRATKVEARIIHAPYAGEVDP